MIGNSSYAPAGELANPKNDATDVAAALKSVGFRVIEGFDLNKSAFDRKIRDFATALSGADAGAFFYAGHGRPGLRLKKPAVVITPARCDGVELTVGQGDRRCLKPGAGKTEWFKDCDTCPSMVVVPAGSFTMGSPAVEPKPFGSTAAEARVPVSIPRPFAVGRFAVTRGEFGAFADATNYKTDGGCHVPTPLRRSSRC